MIKFKNCKLSVLLINLCLLCNLCLTFPFFGNCQHIKWTLSDAVKWAQKHSLAYELAMNRYQSSMWSYQNYQASFFPNLQLSGVLPEYSRSIMKLTLPSGEDEFVSQNQSFSSLSLGVQQYVSLTGGVLQVSSTFDRLDILGSKRIRRYSSSPIMISYQQPGFGYNSFRWKRKTEPLRFKLASRELLVDLEGIAKQATMQYFDFLYAQLQETLALQNLKNAEKLYHITNDRLRIGSVTKQEQLQLRLQVLNAQAQVSQDSINQVLARFRFLQFFALGEGVSIQLALPDSVQFYEISFREALDKAKIHSDFFVRFDLDRLEASENVARVKAAGSPQLEINSNFGFSNRSEKLSEIFERLENQQKILLRFRIPILDWGFFKTQKHRANANFNQVQKQTEQERITFEQEISVHIARWKSQRQRLLVARETKLIAEENYQLEVERYLIGNVSLLDLNVAQNQRDQAESSYIKTIRDYWEVYYKIRQLTLYDFERNRFLD